jgi:polysaccharide biosynthesis protein PslG
MIECVLLLACAQDPLDESPWGLAPSHASSWGIANWAPTLAETGVRWIRGFNQEQPDKALAVSEKSGYRMCGILAWSPKGEKFSFPVNHIPAWEAWITELLTKTKGRVKYWEVWNEPPNFSESKSPKDYGKIVASAYKTAKAVDPKLQIGLAAQSVNLSFLAEALDAGAAGNFDYVTVHPYEVMDMVDRGWEAQYMSIVPTVRKLLADKSPTKKDVPIIITECGTTVEKQFTQERQADQLVKVFILSLAQGVKRIHWFEGIDGDSGPFGLIAGGNGSAPKRLSFTALTQLIKTLGHAPKPAGWWVLDGQHFAFAFEGAEGPVVVAWAAHGATSRLSFGSKVRVVQPRTGATSEAEAVELTNAPVLILGVPAAKLAESRAAAAKPFPWGGDYTGATSVSWDGGAGAKGLHPIGDVKGGDVSSMGGVSFTVDPNFLSYTTVPIRIAVKLRRNGEKAAGFNFGYEATSGFKGGFGWYTIPEGKEWTTKTWTIKDPQFVGKFGYHFSFNSDSTQHSAYSIQSVTVTKE